MGEELKILIAGGGTGGHLFPAIAVAEEFDARSPDARITFAGTARGLEARIIPHTKWNLILMNVPSIKGMGPLSKLKSLLYMPLALIRALFIVSKVGPDIVVSVGGYSAGPVTLAASLIGKRAVAMEQNAVAGLTNRILGRFVKKVFVTFPESAGYFPRKKVIVSGNPVRRKIKELLKAKPARRRGFNILVFGGSQGARTINEKMLDTLNYLAEVRDDIHIVHQVGRAEDIERFSAAYRAKGFSAEAYHFIEDMGRAYSTADLVICRAGSTSLAELTVVGRPAILVPYPYAADNHQEANAASFADDGAAIMIKNGELTGELLAEHIRGLIEEPLKLASMAEAMRRRARPDAACEIVNECMRLVHCKVKKGY
jgi:UDP-N-acetylglucosamine--N-acetylmuramyl-(pentapeptide) pyrophosphoryl-undecaprenol N-acetylglucosamine transferase